MAWHSLAWLMHDSSKDVRRTLLLKLTACTDVNVMMGTRFTLPFLSLVALDADKELRAVVQREGLGNWQQKAQAFSTSRSGDSLRQRWGLIKDAEPGQVAALTNMWTTDELESLGKLVKKEGAGDWDTKAELLGTGRTARALERKWMKIVAAQRKANERSEGQGMEQELQEEPSPLSSPAGAGFRSARERERRVWPQSMWCKGLCSKFSITKRGIGWKGTWPRRPGTRTPRQTPTPARAGR